MHTSQLYSDENILNLRNSRACGKILTEIENIDPTRLSASAQVDLLSTLQKLQSFLQHLVDQVTVAISGTEEKIAQSLWDGADDPAREEVAAALRMSVGNAQVRIDVARTLATSLPHTQEALKYGEISPEHARFIAQDLDSAIRSGFDPKDIEEIELAVLSFAEHHTPRQVSNRVRYLIAQHNPELFAEKVSEELQHRRVEFFEEKNGMMEIHIFVNSVEGQAIKQAIEAGARMKSAREVSSRESERIPVSGATQVEIDRRIDNRRADAAVEIATHFLSAIDGEYVPQGIKTTVNVTVDLETLLGLQNNPAKLDDGTVIPAFLVRELSNDSQWKRFVTEPLTGELLDLGRESYVPNQALRNFIISRDKTCRFPGCRQPSRIGDIDHVKSWDTGGETNPENLVSLCRRHHVLKTHNNWQLKLDSEGACIWTSPTGKIYRVKPPPINSVA